jgi:hypothetical protein
MPLPAWLTQDGSKPNMFHIDPDIAYPAVIARLEQLNIKTGDTDQYWLEVAFQITKIVAQDLIGDADLDPRPAAALILNIQSDGGRKGRWAMRGFNKGKGTIAATKGKEARNTYGGNTSALRAALIAAN